MYSSSYIFASICLSLVSVSLTNTMTKSNVGEERFYLAYVYSVPWSHSGLKETKAGTETRALKEYCLLAFVPCLAHPAISHNSGTHAQELLHLHWAGFSHISN